MNILRKRNAPSETMFEYVCECAPRMLLNVHLNGLDGRSTSNRHFGKYMVNILCFSRSLSLEDKLKVLLL